MTLSADVQKLIDEQLQTGRYHSADDVVAAALTQFAQNQQLSGLAPGDLAAIYPEMHQKLAEGLAAADAGRVIDGESFFDDLERESASQDG